MRSVALSLLLLAPCCAAPSPGGWDYHSSGDVGQPVPLDVTADPLGPVDTGLDAPTDRAAPPDGEIVAPDLAATELSEPPRVRVCT
ncbi:MAG: hypothetical protein FJ098_14165, partial [Deltaproteobacteria bacterium]|nr:hypothetical protein [Deltaproteobacteria bacterium]